MRKPVLSEVGFYRLKSTEDALNCQAAGGGGKGGERHSQRLEVRDGMEKKHLVGNKNVSHNSGQPLAAAGFHMLNLLYHSEFEPVEGWLINKSISSVL